MTADFRGRINEFVRSMTRDYIPTANGEKIIHDPIWGSVVFHPWEVRLIDSPLFQRLRSINQVGLAESTYPAARHSRFEHSLGTAAVASRMTEGLLDRAKKRPDLRHVIGEEDVLLLRMAALLHDLGHGPYSHLSEAIYGRMPQFKELRQAVLEQTGQEISPSPHEILSYLIVVSDAFVTFFHRHVRFPGIKTNKQAQDLLFRAANLIVGAVNVNKEGEKLSFLTGILNGNFDADKLDYTQRDSYTAGIALTYGVERFLLKLDLCKIRENEQTDYRLAIAEDALSTVEELIFNRSMLYHYMYRHQKVLAAEAQMRDAIYALVQAKRITHPCDFLFLTNQDLGSLYRSRLQPFTSFGAKGKTLESLYKAFSRRTLSKRAFLLAPQNFSEYSETGESTDFPAGITGYVEHLRHCTTEEYIEERQTVAKRIAEAYQKQGREPDFDAFDLAISFQPMLKTALHLTVTDKHGQPVDASPVIEGIREWTETLNRSKWRGYLFVAPHVDRVLAGEVFHEYLKERCAGDQLPLLPADGTDNILC